MATQAESWTREEVEATVADYLHMLTEELAGQQYSKAEHRRRLIRLLNNRSGGAIERKHMNISAILIDLGCPSIPGYKPLGNYQTLLFDVVTSRIRDGETFDRAALAAAEMPAVVPVLENYSGVMQIAPALQARAEQPKGRLSPKKRTPLFQRDYLSREARNASLGLAGEEFVLNFERWRLMKSGKPKLAEKVDHVSRTKGDGLGYDILSYERSGQERLIEVKTTAFAKETPFFVTRTEIDVSQEQRDLYHLFRVFEFRKAPRLFTLSGSIDKHCYLDPITYQARFS